MSPSKQLTAHGHKECVPFILIRASEEFRIFAAKDIVFQVGIKSVQHSSSFASKLREMNRTVRPV